jgi:hypothetical protein
MYKKDLEFFKPLWRRLMIVFLLTGWTAMEWWYENTFWATLTSGALAYCLWLFIANYRKIEEKPRND